MSSYRWPSKLAVVGCLLLGTLSLAMAQTDSDKKITPEQHANPCASTDNADVADLCEQRRMANAADRQVDLVARQTELIWWQNLGNFLQGALLFLTLAVTAGAAVASAIAARAANRSAKALADIERAYVFFHPLSDNFEGAIFSDQARSWLAGQKGISPPKKPRIKIRFRNLGKTPASVVEIQVGLHHTTKLAAEDWAKHSLSSLREPVFAAGQPFDMDITHKQGLVPGDYETLNDKQRSYFIQGRILYRTCIDDPIKDKPRETTFCWRYNFRKKYWREHGGPLYNRRS